MVLGASRGGASIDFLPPLRHTQAHEKGGIAVPGLWRVICRAGNSHTGWERDDTAHPSSLEELQGQGR